MQDRLVLAVIAERPVACAISVLRNYREYNYMSLIQYIKHFKLNQRIGKANENSLMELHLAQQEILWIKKKCESNYCKNASNSCTRHVIYITDRKHKTTSINHSNVHLYSYTSYLKAPAAFNFNLLQHIMECIYTYIMAVWWTGIELHFNVSLCPKYKQQERR